MCVADFNACISSPCRHNGQCDITSQGFKCRCNGSYDGPTCSGMYCAIPAGVGCIVHRNTRSIFSVSVSDFSQKQMCTH